MGRCLESARIISAVFAVLILSACAGLQQRTQAMLYDPSLGGTRWGLVVMTMDGRERLAVNPDSRFIPGSVTKIFPVAAAFHRLDDVAIADPARGASVWLERRGETELPDIVLKGAGDAMLIDADDCERDCLSDLADMVAAQGVARVRDVIGDDTLFPDERWSPGWSHEDLLYRPGAPASALTVNSNELGLEIIPSRQAGLAPDARWRKGDDYFTLINEAMTVEGAEDRLRIERRPGSKTVRLYGTVGIARGGQTIPMAVEDPALVAGWRFRRLLAERGVAVEGEIRARHRPPTLEDNAALPAQSREPSDVPQGEEIARLTPPALVEDLRFLMKQSQNQHAEVLLRKLALVEGDGSLADGLAIVEAMLEEAGVSSMAWDLSDGAGMSVYNRLSPRMVAQFLFWTTQQSWGEAFRETMPIGGVDGTLRRRFRDTSLEGRIFAKTGTLNATNALAGFLLTPDGETLIVCAFANDRPSKAGSALPVLDAALVALAEARD